MNRILSRKHFYVLGAIFIAAVFAYITYKTPTAGDDWGYALGGAHPIAKALEFYQTWSGRFFSELWGFTVAKNKPLWNILNPLFFTLIYLGVYFLANVKKRFIGAVLLILCMMTTVTAQLRMETYTWIMGTTYVIPLCLSLWYFVILRKMMTTRLFSPLLKISAILANVLLFVIGMMMENIAAMMIAAILIALIYSWFERRYLVKYLIFHLIFSVTAFLLMRLSPGSTYRLMRDSADFAALGIFEKIALNYPNFLQQTFLNNYYTVGFFTVVYAGYLLFGTKKGYAAFKGLGLLLSLFSLAALFSFPLGKSFLNTSDSLFSMIFWPCFVIDVMVSFFVLSEEHVIRERSLYYLVIGGGCAVVMLMSPIYGARSSLYTVYYLIVLSVILFDSYKLDWRLSIPFLLVLIALTGMKTMNWIRKYDEVGEYQKRRLEIIEYYRTHPEEEDVWIPRMPIASVHGADIEDDDTYHLETFRYYYDLPQEADHIHFFYEEENR